MRGGGNASYGGETVSVIEHEIENNPSLMVLNLESNSCVQHDPETAIIRICGALDTASTKVQTLNLANCNITDRCCSVLGLLLANNKTIHSLMLERNRITCTGLVALVTALREQTQAGVGVRNIWASSQEQLPNGFPQQCVDEFDEAFFRLNKQLSRLVWDVDRNTDEKIQHTLYNRRVKIQKIPIVPKGVKRPDVTNSDAREEALHIAEMPKPKLLHVRTLAGSALMTCTQTQALGSSVKDLTLACFQQVRNGVETNSTKRLQSKIFQIELFDNDRAVEPDTQVTDCFANEEPLLVAVLSELEGDLVLNSGGQCNGRYCGGKTFVEGQMEMFSLKEISSWTMTDLLAKINATHLEFGGKRFDDTESRFVYQVLNSAIAVSPDIVADSLYVGCKNINGGYVSHTSRCRHCISNARIVAVGRHIEADGLALRV